MTIAALTYRHVDDATLLPLDHESTPNWWFGCPYSKSSPPPTPGRMFHAGTICIVPVGLPARGKTYMSKKLCRYLRWLGVKTEVYNIGTYRRKLFGANLPHSFFDPGDREALEKRRIASQAAFEDMLSFFDKGGQVGIYDSTLTIMEEKRRELLDRLTPLNVQVIFVETICEIPHVIEANVREVKLNMPDYEGWDEDKALDDFMRRINIHAPFYTPINDSSLSFVQVMNMGIESNIGEHIVCNNVKGYLQTRMVLFLMNLHISPRTIYLLKNGESVPGACFKDDAPLNADGVALARKLPSFIAALRARTNRHPASPKIFTSTRSRSYQTAQFFPPECVTSKAPLVQMNPGAIEGMSDDAIRAKYPEEYARHVKDPFNHRYPRSESYHDLALRMEHVILELEGEKEDVLVIAHETVLQCLYAYLMDLGEKDIPRLQIPSNTLIELVPQAYGTRETRYLIE
ncbi:hypothetical protein AMAG_10727 [Allomyces macrogynus ATCC 38327]|uniref:6-phosphofructo-2-kinase domain-containing protein n=1 Tax=Allomyces macrogynus (strain ATCC 38327) TaxID=578462 RepID=A0A0L0SRB1_ALLM3|nr:hypothetical protein AMAG_10727 [Allomyces macrogynus ATCC 38327]|eukprot:KNE65063.1 hypothetical protein AMAG_10727 [Allomyces macrogynus ATCC 38327]